MQRVVATGGSDDSKVCELHLLSTTLRAFIHSATLGLIVIHPATLELIVIHPATLELIVIHPATLKLISGPNPFTVS